MKNVVKLTLCQKGCCPTVEFDKDSMIIQDDDGGKVSLTNEQFQILMDHYVDMQGEGE